MRIGIFGGTFAPIHNGHIQIMRYIKEELKMVDKMIIVPAGVPTHKQNKDYLYSNFIAEKRYGLTVASLWEYDMYCNGYSVDAFELKSIGLTQTINLLKHMKDRYPNDHLYFILGSDSFDTIHEWDDFQDFNKFASLIVMERECEIDIKKYEYYITKMIDPSLDLCNGFGSSYMFEGKSCKTHPIYIIKTPYSDISSTHIRNSIRDGISIEDMVPHIVNCLL